MTKAGRNKRRRANRKARRRAEAQARREAAENASDSDSSEVDENRLELLRSLNVSDYSEPTLVGDGMPGYWANRTRTKGLLETTKCRDCGHNFCISTSCDCCMYQPSVIECLCAPTVCKKCFARFAGERGWECIDPNCDQVHTNCSTCRKPFAFPSGINGHNCDRMPPHPTTCVRVADEPTPVAEDLNVYGLVSAIVNGLDNVLRNVRVQIDDDMFELSYNEGEDGFAVTCNAMVAGGPFDRTFYFEAATLTQAVHEVLDMIIEEDTPVDIHVFAPRFSFRDE